MSVAQYWEAHPPVIRLSGLPGDRAVPISVRGDLTETPVFESVNSAIATVDADGHVQCGGTLGQTMILVYGSSAKKSIRYVEVIVGGQSVVAGNGDSGTTTPTAAVWLAWEEGV